MWTTSLSSGIFLLCMSVINTAMAEISDSPIQVYSPEVALTFGLDSCRQQDPPKMNVRIYSVKVPGTLTEFVRRAMNESTKAKLDAMDDGPQALDATDFAYCAAAAVKAKLNTFAFEDGSCSGYQAYLYDALPCVGTGSAVVYTATTALSEAESMMPGIYDLVLLNDFRYLNTSWNLYDPLGLTFNRVRIEFLNSTTGNTDIVDEQNLGDVTKHLTDKLKGDTTYDVTVTLEDVFGREWTLSDSVKTPYHEPIVVDAYWTITYPGTQFYLFWSVVDRYNVVRGYRAEFNNSLASKETDRRECAVTDAMACTGYEFTIYAFDENGDYIGESLEGTLVTETAQFEEVVAGGLDDNTPFSSTATLNEYKYSIPAIEDVCSLGYVFLRTYTADGSTVTFGLPPPSTLLIRKKYIGSGKITISVLMSNSTVLLSTDIGTPSYLGTPSDFMVGARLYRWTPTNGNAASFIGTRSANRARNFCPTIGGRIPNSFAEVPEVAKLVPGADVWVGLALDSSTSTWKWPDNSIEDTSSSNWKSGYPSSNTTESCVYFDSDQLLVNFSCTLDQAHVVCINE